MKENIIKKWSKKIKPWGFEGLSIYDVTIFFWKGLMEGAITTRASSLAFNFFLAFFPAIIFLFTLIPYIPIEGFQETLMDLLGTVLPESTKKMTFKTIDDIINNPRGGLLSVGFILALYFAFFTIQDNQILNRESISLKNSYLFYLICYKFMIKFYSKIDESLSDLFLFNF